MANDESSIGIYQKPFFHEHSIYEIADGKLHAEFMNVPDLGFFVHLAKGEKERLRIPYFVAVWICEQESKLGDGSISMGASDEVIDDGITVTRHKFRFYFAFNGFVSTTGGEPWEELTIEHNDEESSDGNSPNRIVLTRTEYGEFKRWVLRVLDDRYAEAKAREFDHGLFLVGSNLERRVRCELCLQLNGPASKLGASSIVLNMRRKFLAIDEGEKAAETESKPETE